MTRGEAINWIINLTADIGKMEHQDLWHYEQALDEIRDMIEELPSAQPTQTNTPNALKSLDCIDRQAAIDAINALHDMPNAWLDCAVDAVMELPSAQLEIIHCKDCKNSEHWYRDRRRCFLWSEDGVSVFDDGFCNYAERREE